ncbi:MAG: cobalamin biosynthesis protein CobD [Acidimicrobiales bacterium]|nr:cobalamin biosynthesis protein CobD [Acidimicrobiales bacterium]
MGAAAGIAVDRAVGEPPAAVHPVALLGSVLGWLERSTYRDARLAGVVHAALGTALAAGAGVALQRALGPGPATAAATAVAVAGRMLGDTALAVAVELERGDLDRARVLLPALVGRDPSGLGEGAIARAVVESVAENTVDAVVAPALWGAVLGAPGALGYRAVNTLDAMVGHRSARYERFGWASARLDDAAGWVPARVAAALVALVRPASAGAVWEAVRSDARAHPSPNAGVAEAAFAAALGLRLGGENRYGDRVEVRATLGEGRPPAAADIGRAVGLSADVGAALAGALVLTGGLGRRRGRLRPPAAAWRRAG